MCSSFNVFIFIGSIINLSPQHPATHGVLRLIAILNAEIIYWISPEIGLLHRGTEKLMECNYYNSNIGYFDRLDYVSCVIQELCYILVLERLFNSYGSIYISLWRTLLIEFYRNLNHSLNITTHAIDIGLFTTMLWKFEEREKLINYIEILSGTRFHAVFLLINKLRFDISLFFIDSFIYWLLYYIRKLKEIHNILSINRLWRTRLYEIGIVNKDFCLYFGITGIIARSIKIIIDGRFTGYEFYDSINYSSFYSSNGDCLDRYILRFNEMIESCRIIYSLLYILLSSFYYSSFSILSTSMELLIEEFLSSFPLILTLIKQLKLSIESSKGIYSIYLFSFPFLIINIITNDFLTVNQLNKYIKNINLGDLIAVLGSIDFVLGSVDLIILFFCIMFVFMFFLFYELNCAQIFILAGSYFKFLALGPFSFFSCFLLKVSFHSLMFIRSYSLLFFYVLFFMVSFLYFT